MPKHTSGADSIPVRVVIITLDNHLSSAVERATRMLRRELPGLSLRLHAAAEWGEDQDKLQRCRDDIATADFIIANLLVMEDHIAPILDDLKARQEDCDALVAAMSSGEVIRLTRMGQFRMGSPQSGAIALLKRLRGSRRNGESSGARQMAMLRRLPRILRYIPGTAQDVRAYFLCLQYWLASSEANLSNLIRLLVNRYASGPRSGLRGSLTVEAPLEYPETGVYHPRMKTRVAAELAALPAVAGKPRGRVGLLVMRSYVLAGNSAHYDSVIAAFEERGLEVIPVFASGLDMRPAVEKFFMQKGRSTVDAVVSLTGFSLVGGPAYNDSRAAEEMLARLDVPYITAQAVEFQSLDQWQESERGLMPVEATMMVAIPELDGATGSCVFGGRSSHAVDGRPSNDMQAQPERVATLAARVERLVVLRHTARSERRVAIVLFNFPPNSGSTGTAAHLSVFASLHNTLRALRDQGYTVEVPDSVESLRDRILNGNAPLNGTQANVHTRITVDDHVRGQPWLQEIEAQWGPAPGKEQTDGRNLFILGERFGNVLVGIQPAFGYEGDPMRLLFERGFAPTHAFAAFYRYLDSGFGAHSVLHFGTHGALEFMPGKQVGLSDRCWPERLIGALPNFYLYAANNPSEGTIAKRRSAATLISYLTPPVTDAGLYRGLVDLKSSLDHWRGLGPEASTAERERLADLIRTQAEQLELDDQTAPWPADAYQNRVQRLTEAVYEIEQTLIPHGLHIVGEAGSESDRIDLLLAAAEAAELPLQRAAAELLTRGGTPEQALVAAGLAPTRENLEAGRRLADIARLLNEDHELPALLHALDGGFTRPVPGGDLLRNPDILPTGRNLHGFDPYRMPSSYAIRDGSRQAALLLARHEQEGRPLPETVAMVLWGTDNLKTEGAPLGQILALMGVAPRSDSFGRLCGVTLIPLEELGRPRIDVIITTSGIFRDLLPLQMRMLAEAAFLAAGADEDPADNFIRKHALVYQQEHGVDLETAALRVFSNADGAYGANVNQMIDGSCWQDDDELADTYLRRKSFAYGRSGRPVQQTALLETVLSGVELTFQNLDSVELGITTIDHYFDTLGGISRSVRRARGSEVPIYIGDQTHGQEKVRTLSEQVALETRTRALNPKWYEGMLEHGYEGVRQIEHHVSNTMGWSATTGQVANWVYEQLAETFVLDEQMRDRLTRLNPVASAKMANRLIEAHERHYWTPDATMIEALRKAGDELEDRLEGVGTEEAA
ncbi:MAG: magnesium chelatase subunit H [Gammaproteobacteria bacterium]|nr:magnesium chelatase subunit H [Pseudomonadales bacterium]MCP5347031.1 magnesium chelatase subunit H [Pseudomonadales bacterium]